jgi:hypothetical protein
MEIKQQQHDKMEIDGHYKWLVVWNLNFMTFHINWEFHHPN